MAVLCAEPVLGILYLMTVWLAANSHKFYCPLAALLAAGAILAWTRLRWDLTATLLCLMVIHGSAVGLLLNHNPRAFIPHLFSGIFSFLLYIAGVNFRWDVKWIDRVVVRTSYIIVGLFFLSELYFWYRHLSGNPLFLGFSASAVLILPLLWAVARRKWTLAGIVLLMIVLSGKRGVYLSTVVALLLMIPSRYRCFGRRIAVILVLTALLLGSTFLLQPWIEGNPNIPVPIAEAASKWFLLNPLHIRYNWDIITSGRSSEITLAIESLNQTPIKWITGAGYGWNYVWTNSNTGDSEVHHYVHFSPLYYAIINGLPLAAVLLLQFYAILRRAYSMIITRYGQNTFLYVLFAFLVSRLVNGLTAANWTQDIQLWLLMGMLSGLCAHPKSVRNYGVSMRHLVLARRHRVRA
jgi:hypothetical protein